MFCDHLTVLLPSKQFEGQAAFYRDTMCLPCAPTAACDGAQARFYAGRTGEIRVLPAAEGMPCGPTALWAEAAYVDHTYAVLHKRHNAPLLVDIVDAYYSAREFQVLDPDGNIFCVMNYAKDLQERRAQADTDLYADEFRSVLYVKNLQACYDFYTRVLGLRDVYAWEENRGDRGYKYEICSGGSSYIETLFREPLSVQRQGIVALRAKNAEACYQTVLSRAPEAVARPLCADLFGAPGFSVCDPDGNLILIWQNIL